MTRLDGAKAFSQEKGYLTIAANGSSVTVPTKLNIVFGGFATLASTAAPAAVDNCHPGFVVTATATGSNAGFVCGTGVTFYAEGTAAAARNYFYCIEGAS